MPTFQKNRALALRTLPLYEIFPTVRAETIEKTRNVKVRGQRCLHRKDKIMLKVGGMCGSGWILPRANEFAEQQGVSYREHHQSMRKLQQFILHPQNLV